MFFHEHKGEGNVLLPLEVFNSKILNHEQYQFSQDLSAFTKMFV